jgi:predicted DCC family thiol-disulfide oxidoreductase YuxK
VPEKPTLLYDGDCGFCQFSIDQLKKRDPKQQFEYTPAFAYPAITESLKSQSQREVILVHQNKILGGADAALTVYCTLKPWSPLQIFRIPPGIWIARVIYRIIANNRLKISRILGIPATCEIPKRN